MPFLNLNHFSFVLPYDENGLKQDKNITSQIYKDNLLLLTEQAKWKFLYQQES